MNEFYVIAEFPTYKINKNGDVNSLPRNGRSEKILKRNTCKKTGYQSYLLYNDKIKKRLLIHRLVAICFIPNPEGKLFVNHKDGNKLNNESSNLEWCTHSENEIHAHSSGLKNFKGDRAHYKKVLSKDVKHIRSLFATGNFTQKEIAKEYNIDQSTVSKIITKSNWSSI